MESTMIYDATMTKDLIKIIADKLAIGLLVLFSGYMLNRGIEKYKAAQALKSEISKQRFSASLQRIERQLSEFYWPMYLRLQKDNTVWRRLLDKGQEEDDPLRRIGSRIEIDFILPNHNELVKIIETKIHLAEPSAALQAALLSYIDHVAVYNAAIAAGCTDLHGSQRELLTPWPRELFPLIEDHTLKLQREYVILLNAYEKA
jgi:hypothetical protein